MQEAWAGYGDNARLVMLPAKHVEVIPGVPWGSPEFFNTPAYWAVRCLWETESPNYVTGSELLREVTFCLLGGFGIKYEVNLAAFERLDERGFFEPSGCSDEATIRSWLLEPLIVDGRKIRYRFPNQRASRLARMCKFFADHDLSGLGATDLREALLEIDGIGPKTASWIVRNCLGSDDVAIIDVHLIRACQQMQVFPEHFTLPKDYAALEERFLSFSRAISVKASVLDAVIWTEARKSRSLVTAR